MSARLRHLVYMDAIVPSPGETWSSTHPEEVQLARRLAIAEHGALPAPDPALFGLTGADRAWVARRQTPHPGSVYDAKLDFDQKQLAGISRTFIDCTSPALATIAASRSRVRSETGWNIVEIRTGHDAMISAPQDVLEILDGIARSP
jgi:hypothetical protein